MRQTRLNPEDVTAKRHKKKTNGGCSLSPDYRRNPPTSVCCPSSSSRNVHPSPQRTISMSSDIFILWWTLHYDTDRYNFYRIHNCGLPYTCQMTINRSHYGESPLVIFQRWQMNLNDLPPKEDVYSGKKAWVYNSGKISFFGCCLFPPSLSTTDKKEKIHP